MGTNVTEMTEELVQPILDELQLKLVDISFVKEGNNWYLRVFVDKNGGVDIEECGRVSEKLSEKLDEQDPVTFPYFLEVSSPGVERPLKNQQDFEDNIGNAVYVKLYEPINGAKEIEGKLKSFQDDVVTLEVKVKANKKEIQLPYEKIAKARLAVTFN
ncbi:ribosome maturation factor RimP [Aquibacillus sp. 3ASR75-11]|uniref:Ribosome maturation factor RimP n=1 Tax=Terrihalobacillus insolitus TaxID=2950438 RepID=A0A9X3WPP8_9BACI|nr:ribosome maturation factor RimP [Terrihalobacillus insolitus]MDC3414104.1 ribosome maturation factor RimP [Terrihalobacillus insolitus]MDC3423545.1 ribosome maturation factor RimP [Terrihalobacillus insolitus]